MNHEKDIFKSSEGDIEITFIGHGTLMLEFNGRIIHVDPWSRLTDYSLLPKADLILITHEHPDHLDPSAVDTLKKENTRIICNGKCRKSLIDRNPSVEIMENGDSADFDGILIEAVPAYNKRKPFHPKGQGNGYVLNPGSVKLYIAGDTENIPEMKNLQNIDIAFLPMNLPFTMTPKMAANAALAFRPDILYPYHFGKTNAGKLVNLLEGSGIDVRIRRMA